MSLEQYLELVKLKEEAFDILLYVSAKHPVNINSVREASYNHSIYCCMLSRLIAEGQTVGVQNVYKGIVQCSKHK